MKGFKSRLITFALFGVILLSLFLDVYCSPTEPNIARFTAEPSFVYRGQSTTLSWDVERGDKVTIEPGIDIQPQSGNKSVTPESTTSYTLTASNKQGTVTRTATVHVCANRLDDKTLKGLVLVGKGVITGTSPLEVQPSETVELSLWATTNKPWPFSYAKLENACVQWLVSPQESASINTETGVLTVRKTAPPGSRLKITANIENGRRLVTGEAFVFTQKSHPLAGIWSEQTRFECNTGKEIAADTPISELIFTAAGSFSVTWEPFETYRDYWGTYKFDIKKNTVSIKAEEGNNIPQKMSPAGKFSIDDKGRLILNGIWFGNPEDDNSPPPCGYKFELKRMP